MWLATIFASHALRFPTVVTRRPFTQPFHLKHFLSSTSVMANSTGFFNGTHVTSRRSQSSIACEKASFTPESSDKPFTKDHAIITAHESRNEVIPHEAKITRLENLNSAVKLVELQLTRYHTSSFQCGQWVDLMIPGVDIIGGFSIISIPSELPKLQLAVKRAQHPPAHWVHTKAYEGCQVQIRIGGSFYYNIHQDPERHRRHLFLVAGGIGLTPLYSILKQWSEWVQSTEEGRASNSITTLIYSARTQDDMILLDELFELQSQIGRSRFRICLTETSKSVNENKVSREETKESHHVGEAVSFESDASTNRDVPSYGYFEGQVLHGRATDFDSLLHVASKSPISDNSTLAFICGPPRMTDAVAQKLIEEVKLPPENVVFEKWW